MVAVGKLLRRQDFVRIQSQGRRFRHKNLVLYTAPGEFRVGFTVSRKVGPAVVRNRVRRRLRESIRLHPERLAAALDYVVIAAPSAARATYHELDAELDALLSRVRTAKGA